MADAASVLVDGYADSIYGSSAGSAGPAFGCSPDSPLPGWGFGPLPKASALPPPGTLAPLGSLQRQPTPRPASTGHDFLHVSLATVLGSSEILGHSLEDRTAVSRQQDTGLLAGLEAVTSVPLRDASQEGLFTVAPLDVLVTRDEHGRNTFHIIEINGTGIAGLTNLTDPAVECVLRDFSELPANNPVLAAAHDCLVLVASSGQETYPPVSRTMHEKMLYVEALKRGFEATGRSVSITNMTRLEKKPDAMPRSGPTIVLGYMKQFRANFMMDPSTGRLLLFGRQVHAAINDRFVLNTLYQFNHQLDLTQFSGHNKCFVAGADKGVAYELYNMFFEEGGAAAAVAASGAAAVRATAAPELIKGCGGQVAASKRPLRARVVTRREDEEDDDDCAAEDDEDDPVLEAAQLECLLAGGSVDRDDDLDAGHDGDDEEGDEDEAPVHATTASDAAVAAVAAARAARKAAAGDAAWFRSVMAPVIHFKRAATRDELVDAVLQWLREYDQPGRGPAVIKPQGTGCGHGIEFFFNRDATREEVAARVDRAIQTVGTNYNLQCGGLPFTVCQYLNTATIMRAADGSHQHMVAHKFELRIVVYRDGGDLRAFPSIAKVARDAYDPEHPDNKRSLINNITTSAKETASAGQEFMLPLARPETLAMLGIGVDDLTALCAACTHFVRFVVDRVQDDPAMFGLPC